MWLWLWGVAGAFVFAAPSLSLSLWSECLPSWTDAACKRVRRLALSNFAIALVTGGVFSAGLTQVVAGLLAKGVDVGGGHFALPANPVAVALTIGWSANYLWPRILRRLGEQVDKGVLKSDP